MSELAGGLGEGMVLVFQPATPNGVGLDVALGIQRFWQKSLKQSGRRAACFTAIARIESIEGVPPDGMPIAVGDKSVAQFANWADTASNAALVQSKGCRWGMVATLTAAGRAAKLETLLIEAKPADSARTIATWSFDSACTELPEHIVGVLSDTGRRLGTKFPWTHAAQAFDTDDAGAAMLFLEMMGVLSMAEDGCRLTIENVLNRLAVLVEAAPRSRVVVALVPELLGHLARLGAHDIQLAGWMRRIRKSVGATPSEWDGLLDRISRARASEPGG